MAFWGVEIKPGRCFTHTYDSVKGRLHISQATLGIGSATVKSLVQCNVGNKSPVFLCSLVPGKAETCQLNLEFEEADEVIFSVIGPLSVHLTGFYLAATHHSNRNPFYLSDNTESYGEDIPETEERSADDSDEDAYEDSFIDDDGDDQVTLRSPISNGGIIREEVLDKEKPKKAESAKSSHRRLRKKYQLSESDNESDPQPQNINVRTGGLVLESEDEDSFPISSLYKNKTTVKNSDYDPEEKVCNGTVETSNKKTQDDGNCLTESNKKDDAVVGSELESLIHSNGQSDVPSDYMLLCDVDLEISAKSKKTRNRLSTDGKTVEADGTYVLKEDNSQQYEANAEKVDQENKQDQKATNDKRTDLLPCTEVHPEDGVKPKKRRKRQTNEEKTLEADNTSYIDVIKEDNAQQDEANADKISQDLPRRQGQNQKHANNEGADLLHNVPLSSTVICSDTSAKPKKKRKEREKEGIDLEDDYSNAIKDEKIWQDEAKAMDQDLPMKNEQNHIQVHDTIFEEHGDGCALDKKSEEKKTKKKKKKSKTQENEAVNMNISDPSKEKNIAVVKNEDNNGNANSSQVRTLPNGLIIEELEMGKPDGKIAAPGKKISVHYIGKLKNGQVFDSNVDGAPFKFHLGENDILDGWNVGLDGMRVGDKRRLIVPPSMGYGSEGVKNVPPNSWLVYEVKLVKVR